VTTRREARDFTEQFGFSAGYVEKLYSDYLAAPGSVGEEWRSFFDQLADAPAGPPPDAARSDPRPAPEISHTDDVEPLRGLAARIADNMEESLGIPTATSARDVPVKVLEENRRIINQHLAKAYRGKASFTQIVAWAMVDALRRHPAMTASFVLRDEKPHRRSSPQVDLGVAVDVVGRNGERALVVPNIKNTTALDFAGFLRAYDDVIARARNGRLLPEDFQDTTCTLTNPGMIGTVSSLPRLMAGQSFILATGAIAVPAAYRGAAPGTLTEIGVSKVMVVTSTYDHRVIQGAESGQFLATMDALLGGEHGFYERIFADLQVPHRPLQMRPDRRSALGSPLREFENMERAAKVMQYIRSYRVRGYLLADLDPLQYEPTIFPELEMDSYGLTIWDLDREFFTGGATGKPMATLREIRETLEDTYARHVGVEYMHIADPVQKGWLLQRMEATRNEEELSRETILRVLDRLVEAEAFERFLHKRFVGHKRFSIEGGETLIPVLDALLAKAASLGVPRVVLGMAHRGRLNVLVHVIGKELTKIFAEFDGYLDPDAPQGSGDVKYHLGARGVFRTPDGDEIEIELASNPSHLEAVDPVVQGMARARQTKADGSSDRNSVLPILIHGDAAFAGQGVVAETLNMSQLPGYRTGGTVHLIVNNQIGYTTLPADARSTPFCTDVAKAIQAPIFHVNGDDPLAAVRMVRLALDYRQEFRRDVVVDIVCYRRWGHNEGDEPSFTQPLLYRKIESHASVREIYQDYLLRAGVLQPSDVDTFHEALGERLRTSLDEVRSSRPFEVTDSPAEAPEPSWDTHVPTAVSVARIRELTESLVSLPEGFTPHPKVTRLLERRHKMTQGEVGMDFATAETLAYATLLSEGVSVRLAGQDSGRGTFSQRHAVLLDVPTGRAHIPLQFLAENQAPFLVIDSLLSEEAALGFEYGYAVARPDTLTLWEAQFGDFANGAQTQIDQFISAGEAKWGQSCGLVLLLPHGYDGQGPEHSSARLERFLQICAEGNMRVANPSTPAQLFHLLRRQALDATRKPLVVMTTKSLLRLQFASSPVSELAASGFETVIDDPETIVEDARRVVLCTGKVYYDMLAERQRIGVDGVALVRVEQLYPWPGEALDRVLARYASAERVWCQEEPANMGGWTHVRTLVDGMRYIGRPASASPATGSLRRHKAEQMALVRSALEKSSSRITP
jgi:2-oxoglutarate dehydrogenase E1 component